MADEQEDVPQGGSSGRARWKPGEVLPFGRFWWKDWLGDPAIRRLTPEQRGRFMDVRAATYGTATPGEMTEADVQKWAGYTPDEWKKVREDFKRCFKVKGSLRRWFLEDIRADHAASLRVARLAYEKGMKGVAARKRGKDLATTGSTPGTTPGQPGVQPQLDTEVRSQIQEIQKLDKPEAERRAPRAQMRSRAGSAGSAGSSRELPLEGIVARAFDGNPPARRGSA